jgi:rSAM/selenodomain-associated transferase 1
MTPGNRGPEPTRIAVFAKAPVAGQVKTRLVPLLGADGAAALHAGLVRRSLATACEARLGPVELWCAPDARHPFFERCAEQFHVGLRVQEGADLGSRMADALARGLEAGTPTVIIGSDCPSLAVADLREAATALASHAVAIAPAEDGGYVLVGASRRVDAIFESIAWGSAAVMGQTRARLAQQGIDWRELPARWDVDRPEDYARLKREGRLDEVMS